ncbi:MAG: hypothetical protein QW568_02035 [Candidatus Anstonellaceae archaeon]
MFEGLKNGAKIFKDSLHVLVKYPVFAVPLLIVWLLMAPLVLYTYFNSETMLQGLDIAGALFILFGIIYFYSLLFSFSCIIMLELIQQHETGKPLNLKAAVAEGFQKDFIAVLVLSFFWAIIWVILTVIEALLSSVKDKNKRSEQSTREAAKALTGQGGAFSWLGLGIDMVRKLVRLFIFLVLPAVAWEDRGVIGAVKRGGSVVKSHISEFLTAYAGSGFAAALIFLPLAIFFQATENMTLPDYYYYIAITYGAMAWVLSMYIEQMNMALLFMWHKKWETASQKAQAAGKPIPTMSEIPMPSLLDDIPDLLEQP